MFILTVVISTALTGRTFPAALSQGGFDFVDEGKGKGI
jgi:hypothetical protein